MIYFHHKENHALMGNSQFTVHNSQLKKLLTVLLCSIILLSFPFPASANEAVEDGASPNPQSETGPEYKPLPRPEIYSASGIVMDAKTGAIIFEKNIHDKRAMASTTKLMTALLAIESGNPERDVTITEDMMYWEAGTNEIGLKPGDTVSMHDLIIACLMYSANDAAQAIAVELGGSFEGFAGLMNKRALEIGMSNTNFVTPSGLSADEHYSSAYDMALLGIISAKTPGYLKYTSMARAVISFGSPEKEEHPISTHNYLLEGQRRGYEGCDGLKTGYTSAAGSCFVSHVERNGVSLVCATLGASSTSGYLSDHTALYNYALSRYKPVTVSPTLPSNNIPLVGGTVAKVPISASGSVSTVYVLDTLEDVFFEQVFIDSFAYAPVSKGEVVGYTRYLCGSIVVAEIPIQIDMDAGSASSDWLTAYGKKFKKMKSPA